MDRNDDPMKWSVFIDHITDALGYEGEGDNFDEVTAFLKTKKADTEKVTDDEGTTYKLRELFDGRPGKPLNVTAAKSKARTQNEILQAAREIHDEWIKETGQDKKPAKKNGEHKHDVKVGQMRLAEDPKGGFKHAGEFYRSVYLAGRKEDQHTPDKLTQWQKATLSTYGSEGVGADGGFGVPPEFRAEITSRVMGEDSILSMTDQYPLAGNSIAFPDDENTPWDTTNGIRALWEGEAGAQTQSKPVLKLKELKLRKVTALVPVTEELLEDAPAMSAYVTRKAGEKLDFAVGEAIFRGTGAGQPQGFLNSDSLVTVAKETNQAADTVTGINIIKMYSRMYAPYRREAVWFINQDIEPQLLRLSVQGRSDTGGAVSGFGGLIYMPPGGLSGSPFGTLFGRRVMPTQHSATLGDVGDISFASMRQYVTAVKSSGLESATSMHLWFDQDVVAFKIRMRVDGQTWLSDKISPRDGSNTLSGFVTLAARA